MQNVLELRIHGDNIVECERALAILVSAVDGTSTLSERGSAISPRFEVRPSDSEWAGYEEIAVELLPGHGRWGVDIARTIREMGSPLRENADAVVTHVLPDREELLLAFEFCGALPAGNNAWQRHGRAFSFAHAGVPYLILAEVGGSELAADRTAKASRLPSPAVPASLLLLSAEVGVPVLPVYEVAPSAPSALATDFESAMGRIVAEQFVAATVLGHDTRPAEAAIRSTAARMVDLLADGRKRTDSLSREGWRRILTDPDERYEVYDASELEWSLRGLGTKVRKSPTAQLLFDAFSGLSPRPLGASGIRFAYASASQRPGFGAAVRGIYGDAASDVAAWIERGERQLVLVVVTGFKPKGEDSRPDRGLAPMARMLAGGTSDVLTFIWGPAPVQLVKLMGRDISAAALQNGLIESVVATSDAVIVDSPDSEPLAVVLSRAERADSAMVSPVLGVTRVTAIGEQDVDTVTHLMFTQPMRPGFFEGLCNPPGGDWSGISLLDDEGAVSRWTSLPRVSQSGGKRPDHVIQVTLENRKYVLAIESKAAPGTLEKEVGPALCGYVKDLVAFPPSVTKRVSSLLWDSTIRCSGNLAWSDLYSAGVFVWTTADALGSALARSECHWVGGWDLNNPSMPTLHVLARSGFEFLVADIALAAATSGLEIKVEEYGFPN